MVASAIPAACVGETGALSAGAGKGLCALSASAACRSAPVTSGSIATSVCARSVKSRGCWVGSALRSVDAPAWGDTALGTGMDSSGGNKAEGADGDAAGDAELAKRVGTAIVKDLKQQLAYYKSLGTPMSEAQFMQNAESAYQNKATEFNNKQAAFIQDILTCYQLINVIESIEKGIPVAAQP